MTKKLYDEMPYETEFQGTILEVIPEENRTKVILDQTLFFPEEGGQLSDIGTLGNYKVVDVHIKNHVIIHELEGGVEELKPGMQVEGCIDFQRRYDFMQHHSGEHVLSGIIYNTYGYNNVGFRLRPDIVTVDCDGPLTAEQIADLELKANAVIRRNDSIVCRYPEKAELDTMEYRSKKEIEGAVRIVSVGDFEQCACCAPHVKSTAEVGCLRIVSWENYKGGTRMEIMCGERAIKDSMEKQRILKQLMQLYSVPYQQLVEAVKKGQQDLLDVKGQLSQCMEELIKKKVESLETQPVHVLVEENLDSNTHRNLVNLLLEQSTKLAAVLVKTPQENSYRYIIVSNEVDTKALQNQLKEQFQAKGGGKSPMIQGTLEGQLEEIIKTLQEA